MKQKSDTRFFYNKFKEARSTLIPLLVISLGINILALASPIYMIQLYDRVLSSQQTATLLILTLLAGLAFATFGLLEGVRGWMLNRVGLWFERTSSDKAVQASLEARLRSQRLEAQPLSDLGEIRSFMVSSLRPILDLPFSPIFFVVAFLLDPLIGWLVLGSAALLFTIAIVNDLLVRPSTQDFSSEISKGHSLVEMAMRNSIALRAMGMESAILKRWKGHLANAQNSQVRASDNGATLMAFSKFVRMFAQALVLGAGAFLVIRGEMSVGYIIAGSIILGRALAPIDQALSAWRSFVKAKMSYDRLLKLDDLIVPPSNTELVQSEPRGHVQLAKLQFKAPGSENLILRNVFLEARPGEITAVIGPSGAGKSTLAKLIVGAWEPTAGILDLDGVVLSRWNREDVGRIIGYLPQSIELFEGTVAENISRFEENADLEAIKDAARAAGVDDLINGLPEGLNTHLAHGGGFLSGGQRQRIGLARALYKRPKLIVLDEPNAHMDDKGEHQLIVALKAAREWGSSIVVICHRPNLLQFADKIMVLVNGETREYGPAKDVRAKLLQAAPTTQPKKETASNDQGTEKSA